MTTRNWRGGYALFGYPKNGLSYRLHFGRFKKLRVVVFSCVLIIVYLFHQHVVEQNKASESSPNKQTVVILRSPNPADPKTVALKFGLEAIYAIMTCDLNLYYLVHIPLMIMHWKNLGVKTLLMITLRPNETLDEAAMKTIKFCEALEAKVIYLHSHTVDIGQFAQTSRAFAAGTEFAHTLNPDRTVFITTDADFYAFNLANHVPNGRLGKKIMVYDYRCCGSVQWKDITYPMLTMGTIGMTLRLWREVLGLPAKIPVDDQFMDNMIQETFDYQIAPQDIFWRWFLDQRFFGLKFYYWKAKHRKDVNRIRATFPNHSVRRLKRFNLPSPAKLRSTDLRKAWESIHVSPGIFMDKVWELNLPVYEQMYTAGQLETIRAFRDAVIDVMDVDETLRRHYHPEGNVSYSINRDR